MQALFPLQKDWLMLTVKFTFRGEDCVFIGPGYALCVEPTKDFSLPLAHLAWLAQEKLQQFRKENKRQRRQFTHCVVVLVEDSEELCIRHNTELLTAKFGERVARAVTLVLCDNCGWLDSPAGNPTSPFYCRDVYCQEVKQRSENRR